MHSNLEVNMSTDTSTSTSELLCDARNFSLVLAVRRLKPQAALRTLFYKAVVAQLPDIEREVALDFRTAPDTPYTLTRAHSSHRGIL